MNWIIDMIADLRGLDPQDIVCDGCEGHFVLNRITPVSGDHNLCPDCFKRWYPEFCEESDS